jgi:signal transduction histidine kinase
MPEPRPLKISVLSDRQEDRDLLAALLSGYQGCRFELQPCSAAGATAVPAAECDAHVVDAALLDGGDLLCRLAATGRPVVVVADQDDNWKAHLAAGAWDSVARPELTPTVLGRTIERAVLQGRQRAADRMQQYARKMEAVGRFAGGVAHDFNNLLTAMLGYAEMLRESFDPNDVRREDVMEIQRAGERATTLTRQLLTFGLRQPVQPRVIDLNAVVERVTAILPPILGNHIELQVMPGGPLDPIRADATQVELLVGNLARNARDAMPSGGRLRIETGHAEVDEEAAARRFGARAGRHVVLTFSDTGTGMTPEVMSHLFEPFFTTREKGKGTGLGLPVALGITRQAGGHITVSSAPGEGTTVRVFFPVAAPSA